MGPDELASYVERAHTAVESSSELGRRNTQLRLVEPFLECLGWDVRSPAVEAAFAVDGTDASVDYALLVDGEPAIFVDTLACETDLDPGHGDVLLSAMGAAGVEWGILTNGRRFAFVARRESGEDGFSCPLSELPDHAVALDRFTPERATEYVQGREQRVAAAAAIADRREAIETAIIAGLLSAAGDDGDAVSRQELRTITDTFLDEVLATVAPDGRGDVPAGHEDPVDSREGSVAVDKGEESAEVDEGEESVDRERDPAQARDETTARSPVDDGAPGTVSDDTGGDHGVDGATPAPMVEDGEYVARLFDGSTSICAIGGSSVAGTMRETVDYLIEQHHLDTGLSLPYVPEDGGFAVLNRVPRHPNGEPMDEYVQLDAGPYLRADGSLADRRDRIERLVQEAGLRVMFQGDWKPR